MPFDLRPRSLLPPPRAPFRWGWPLAYLALLTFALRWSSLHTVADVGGAGAVAVGGWLLGLCTFRASGSRYAPWVGGIAYCFVCSVYAPFGRRASLELVANLFPITAWLIAVAPREKGAKVSGRKLRGSTVDWLPAGLLLGVGMVFHPLVTASLFGVIPYILREYRGRGELKTTALYAFLGGILLPLLLAAGYLSYSPRRDLPFPPGTLEFGDWGGQLWQMVRYLLFFAPLILFSLTGFLRNILSPGRTKFTRILRYHGWGLFWTILLLGGGRPEPLVLLHPVLALRVTEWFTATGEPYFRKKHGFHLLAILALGLGVGYVYFSGG